MSLTTISTAYEAGHQAQTAGKPSSDNPYDFAKVGQSGPRKQWFDGYFDAQIIARLGGVFRRHGIKWHETGNSREFI